MPRYWKIVFGIWAAIWTGAWGLVISMANIEPDTAFTALAKWWRLIEGWFGPNAEWWVTAFCIAMIVAPVILWFIVERGRKLKAPATLVAPAPEQPPPPPAPVNTAFVGRNFKGTIQLFGVQLRGFNRVVDTDGGEILMHGGTATTNAGEAAPNGSCIIEYRPDLAPKRANNHPRKRNLGDGNEKEKS